MESSTLQDCPQSRRLPLRESHNRANIPTSEALQLTNCGNSTPLPKLKKSSDHSRENANEIPESQPTSAEDKRVSMVSEPQPDSKRNSAISTASTASGKSRRKTHIGPWQLGRTLGKGSTGRVRLAKHAATGQRAAIKIVSKKSAEMVQSRSIAAMDQNINAALPGARVIPSTIEREVVIMKLIEHPNIISLYDVWENRGELYLVLEYVQGGELFDYVSSKGALPEIQAVLFFKQILAALSCCHQLNICHRDLKPENILLDADGNVKLADFGMAALQPPGHWLNTSCGSPHYASPEIIYGHRYKGAKADIWSCGIILFAMLAGFLPFDGGDLQNTLKLVKRGEYILPPWLSVEATDLIQRILVMRPDDRLNIPDIMEHPLLKKYEDQPRFVDISLTSLKSLPAMKDCVKVASRRHDIDMDIVRSLRTLWHASTIDQLVTNILTDKPNHEKIFYKALVKFRDEQGENCDGQPLEYSSSDHHHMSRPFMSIAQRRWQTRGSSAGSRKTPDISISVDAPSRKESGAYEEPKSSRTVESYDPYRSSHAPLPNPQAEVANVTIHRHSSLVKPGHRLPNDGVLTQEATGAQQEKADSFLSSDPYPSRIQPGFRRSSLVSFQSRSSLGSTSHPNSKFPSTPRSASYRRNVSFRHLRYRTAGNPERRSVASYTRSQYSLVRNHSEVGADAKNVKRLSSSPSLPTPPPLVRARRQTDKVPAVNVASNRYSCHQWKDDARKVSIELGNICEEAFNRSSVSPSSASTKGSKEQGLDSPPTSVSEEGNEATTGPEEVEPQTPEEPKSVESVTSYAARELAETRKRLVEHSNKASADGMPEYLSEVIAHLDRLISTEASTYVNDRHIHGSDSSVNTAPPKRARPPSLPPISEEDNAVTNGRGVRDSCVKSTAPIEDGRRRGNTIRIVSPDTPPTLDHIKPLTARRKANVLPTLSEDPTDFLSGTLFEDNLSEESDILSPSLAHRRSTRYYSDLDPIEEDPMSPRSSGPRSSGETRKWAWFKHRSHPRDSSPCPPTPPSKDDAPTTRRPVTQHAGQTTPNEPSEAIPMQGANDDKVKLIPNRGSRFLKLFGKKGVYEKKPVHELAKGINDPDGTLGSISSVARGDTPEDNNGHEGNKDTTLPASHLGNKNWFARFFHIKPASKVLALNISKARARKEVVKILREWKKYGIEDVHLDKGKNIVMAKVGELNFLRLRPVEFYLEFYTVLEFGRHVNLSLVKINQGHGATSSFSKVVDTLTVVMKQRSFLVEDPNRAKKMCKVLDTGR